MLGYAEAVADGTFPLGMATSAVCRSNFYPPIPSAVAKGLTEMFSAWYRSEDEDFDEFLTRETNKRLAERGLPADAESQTRLHEFLHSHWQPFIDIKPRIQELYAAEAAQDNCRSYI